MTSPAWQKLEALVQEIRDTAYAEGYQAAIDEVLKVANRGSRQSDTNHSGAMRPDAAAGSDTASPPRRARRGEIEEILSAVLKTHDVGLTVAQLETAAAAAGTPVKTPTLRVALHRMMQAGLVQQDGRNWRPADGATRHTEPDSSPSDMDNGAEPEADRDVVQPIDGEQSIDNSTPSNELPPSSDESRAEADWPARDNYPDR